MAVISFSASGGRLSAFRDAMRFRGIACKHQQIRGSVFYAETAAKNEKRLTALADEYRITLEITERRGLRFPLMPYRRRYGFAAGLLCGGLLLYTCGATVREICITGNGRIPESELRAALRSLGVKEGVPFRSIQYNWLEQRMRLAVSDIEWITVRQEGGRLIVDLTEETLPPDMKHDRMPCNIIADVPAEIVSMNVRCGFPRVKAGDLVRPGDLLISGVQTDLSGICRCYHADGTVTARYPAVFTKEQPFVAELPVSSEVRTQTLLEVLGRELPLGIGFRVPDAPLTRCDETRTPLTLFGKRLPFQLIHRIYTVQDTAVTVFSEEEARALLEESAARFEHNFHANDIIISRDEKFNRTDLGIMLKINYVFEGVIGKTSEIFVK
ncbi:MAG: sporulation protein YqfD [Oscillospiraceae bacterium]|nr:sporulation protein YqfD [Oscillospiraceae bacterium]